MTSLELHSLAEGERPRYDAIVSFARFMASAGEMEKAFGFLCRGLSSAASLCLFSKTKNYYFDLLANCFNDHLELTSRIETEKSRFIRSIDNNIFHNYRAPSLERIEDEFVQELKNFRCPMSLKALTSSLRNEVTSAHLITLLACDP